MEPTPTQASSEPPRGAGLAGASITLTPKAIAMAKNRFQKRGTPDAALRLGVRGGGCSGFNYVIEFSDDPPRERDRVFEFDGVRVYVDKKSLVYLAGSVLDWEQTLMQQGFKFRNPQEAASCGCGHSFTVR
jgi:iron-sulfur cluster assembly protein